MPDFHTRFHQFDQDLKDVAALLRQVEPVLRSALDGRPAHLDPTRSNAVATAALILEVQQRTTELAETTLALIQQLPQAERAIEPTARQRLLSVGETVLPRLAKVLQDLTAMARRDHSEVMAALEMQQLLARVRQAEPRRAGEQVR